MKNLFKYTLPDLSFCALVSCSEELSEEVTSFINDTFDGREMINLSGEGNSATRAAITRAGFDKTNETEVLIKMVAEDGRENPATARNTITKATASVSKTDPNSLLGADFEYSEIEFKNDADKRYWDDAFGRNTKLSVYAVAVPGKSGMIETNTTDGALLAKDGSVVDTDINPQWNSSESNTNQVEWTISPEQSSTTQANEDLTYSNNIQDGKNGGRYTWNFTDDKQKMDDGYLRWIVNPNDANKTTGKFDQGHMIFKHALSWITIKLTEGEGFDHTINTDFIWTGGESEQNIKLFGFTLHGTLDVKNGTWTSTDEDKKEITKLNETTNTSATTTTRIVHAYCLPGRDLSAATGNVIKFQIDHNDYYVTGTQIVKAIQDYYKGAGKNETNASTYQSFTTMKEGANYVINLTVGKKKIENITAHVAEWEIVNSDNIEPSNIHTTFTLTDNSNSELLDTDDAAKFSIYRAKQYLTDDFIYDNAPANYTWATGYTVGDEADKNNSVTATKTYGTGYWNTTWYWPDNRTYYHFRAVGDYAGNALASNFVKKDENDYFEITSGTNYKDYIWGAPFSTTSNIGYSKSTGFDNEKTNYHQIYQAIAATDSPIKMLMFHMTSQIFVKVQTVEDDEPNKVELYKDDINKTIVNVLRFKKDGKVLMGNGLVSAISADVTASDPMSYKSSDNISAAGIDAVNYFYGIVPQTLNRGDNAEDKVGLQIITPDGNEYFIQDLSKYKGTVSANNLEIPYSGTSPYVINEWYPGYQYYYTVTISKTGIQNITAAVLPWETVTGDLGTIDLEN